MPESILLADEDRTLLIKVSSLLEEVVETFSILRLERAEKDVKAGRVRNYDEFLKELKEADEILNSGYQDL
jgi:molybdopterin converting factor small subunit